MIGACVGYVLALRAARHHNLNGSHAAHTTAAIAAFTAESDHEWPPSSQRNAGHSTSHASPAHRTRRHPYHTHVMTPMYPPQQEAM